MSKERNIYKELIDKMFEIAGYDVIYEDIEYRKDNWFEQWTMTEAQQSQWMSWGEKVIKKHRRCTVPMAKKTMSFFALNYGLKLREDG